jgi:hypothetical protein
VTITGEEVDALRAHVPSLLDWACIGGKLDESHPNYVSVTEGRDAGRMQKAYSSCGDLASWLLFRLGCRQPWVNRAEHKGWRVGRNVSALATEAPAAVRQLPVPGALFDTGDILICWNNDDGTDAHVMVVHSFTASPFRLIVGEYGQPGGHVAERSLDRRQGAFYIGRRRVQRWLPLALVLTDAAERGLLEAPSFPEHFTPDTDRAPPPGEP